MEGNAVRKDLDYLKQEVGSMKESIEDKAFIQFIIINQLY